MPANGLGDFPFSAGVVAPRGVAVGVVVTVGSVEANNDFTGVVAGASKGTDDGPPKTVVPLPLLKVVSPPVFHAGTESDLLDAT